MNNLRAFAIFAVIIVHVSGPILLLYNKLDIWEWMIGNFFDGFSRFCVPVFLMLTGCLMLPKPIELNFFLRKRFSKILLPFLFWSIIYLIYDLFTNHNKIHDANLFQIMQHLFIKLPKDTAFHLWYVYMLIGIYLFFPIINKWIINTTTNEIKYFLFIWVLTIFINKLNTKLDLTYFTGFLGYVVLGYYLNYLFTHKSIYKLSLMFILIGSSITILGTYFLSNYKGNFSDSFYGFFSPNIILMSCGFFLFFKTYKFKHTKIDKISNYISQYSYGIFLSHILVLIFLEKIGLKWSFVNPLIGVLLTSITCLFISSILVFMIKKIPFGHYVSG